MSKNKSEKENTKSELVRTPAPSKDFINKQEFKDMVYENLGRQYSRDAVYWIVNEVFNCFEEILQEGKTLMIMDFFTMQPKLRKGRKYDTLTNYGGEGKTKDHYVPYFHPHKKLREVCLALPVDGEKNNREESDEDE